MAYKKYVNVAQRICKGKEETNNCRQPFDNIAHNSFFRSFFVPHTINAVNVETKIQQQQLTGAVSSLVKISFHSVN